MIKVCTWMYDNVLTWRWFVRLVRWLIISGGTVAESAFLVATLYVTACVVAHPLLTWIFPMQVIMILNQVSVLVFSWLPEVIVFSAVKITLDHWKTAWSTKNKWSFVWAIAYTLPTLAFLLMTIITLLSFVSLQQMNVDDYQVSGIMLNARVLSGWFYGIVQMLFDSIGKQGYAETIAHLHEDVVQRENTITTLSNQVAHMQQDMAQLQDQMATQERALFDAQMALATRRMTSVQSPVHFQKGGREGTTPSSAVHLAQKDEANKSAQTVM